MRFFLLFAVLGLVSACRSPEPNFYQPVASTTYNMTYPKINNTILIGTVLLPAEASRPQITTLGDEDYELNIDEFNRWGANPERLFQNTINENLSKLLPNATIENQTSLRKNYKYAVVVEITKMSGRLDDCAILEASYFIKNSKGYIIKKGKFYNKIKIDGEYEQYIPAQSKLLAELCEKIANDLNK
ncbi:MAG: membrane integrity-associated transporter subunit PqiC [Alphaproteobacteria bacterium]|nr:membrane integrity-associated transporter subunit PqiC [Alphaproteobacteria bacterium]